VKFLSGKVVALQLGADSVTVEEVATAQSMEKESLDALNRWLAKAQRSNHAEPALPTHADDASGDSAPTTPTF
jgi:hypothetical protein